jgi:hypothetical protein
MKSDITRGDIQYAAVEFAYCRDYEMAAICRAALNGDEGAWQYVAADLKAVNDVPRGAAS